MPRVLVIGYGNTLRGDDGVGPWIAERVRVEGLPDVDVLVCPQLSPEHADPISKAAAVVFVDATVAGSEGVQWRELQPGDTTQLMGHAADPRTMLALARDVFASVPKAWLLTVLARDTGFSEALSRETRVWAEQAVGDLFSFLRNPDCSPAA